MNDIVRCVILVVLIISLSVPVFAYDESDYSPYDVIEISDDTKEFLCSVVYAEAGNQGLVGMEAVTQVILNRVLNGSCGNTVEDVVSSKGQFAVYPSCIGGYYSHKCKLAVNRVLSGRDAPIGYDVLYFGTSKVYGTTYVTTINQHIFSK